VTQDGQLYENLKEIRAQKIRDLNYDADLERLSKLEGRYRERLPRLSSDPRVKGPLSRISAKSSHYRPFAATASGAH
jgi:NAD-dependent DNA ligase